MLCAPFPMTIPTPTLLSLALLPFLVAPAARAVSDGSCVESDSAFAAVAASVNGAAALSSAPSPERFATTWTSYFAAAVRSAAGTDGRLSLSEAQKLSTRGDEMGRFGDNAVNWLRAKDQQSVAVDKLISAGWDYAFATGKEVAGDDGRISLEDAKGLPEDLREDYLFLRGKLGTTPAGDVMVGLAAAAKDLLLLSESDSRAFPIEAASNATGAITPEEVRATFGALHDEAMRGADVWSFADPDYIGIADRFVDVRDADEWLDRRATVDDPSDPGSVAGAAKWNAFGSFVRENLTDLTVVRFNQTTNPDVAITSSIFVVGRTADGRIVGILAGAVET